MLLLYLFQATFGTGATALFQRIIDLRKVAVGLGYPEPGLKQLAHSVLGLDFRKSRAVTMSNWENHALTITQLRYAALDVFIAGQCFRGLRLWHSSPSPCAACRHDLGCVLHPCVAILCAHAGCGRTFSGVGAYFTHCRVAKHKPVWGLCQACGRAHVQC